MCVHLHTLISAFNTISLLPLLEATLYSMICSIYSERTAHVPYSIGPYITLSNIYIFISSLDCIRDVRNTNSYIAGILYLYDIFTHIWLCTLRVKYKGGCLLKIRVLSNGFSENMRYVQCAYSQNVEFWINYQKGHGTDIGLRTICSSVDLTQNLSEFMILNGRIFLNQNILKMISISSELVGNI